jgi:carbon storage regulator
MGLALSRKPGETVRIGDDISVKIVDARKGRVRLLVDAPRSVAVLRAELSESRRSAAVVARDAFGDVVDCLSHLFPPGQFADQADDVFAISVADVNGLRVQLERIGIPWLLVEPFALRSHQINHWHQCGRTAFAAMQSHLREQLGGLD